MDRTIRSSFAQLLAAVRALVLMTVALGLAYPLVVWGVGQIALPSNANGSLLTAGGRVVGSDLIGQSFTDAKGNALPQYFQSRPSSAGKGYDPTSTAASNLGPESKDLVKDICSRSKAIGASDGVDGAREGCGAGSPASSRGVAVPPDAVTASGSGLDPHISPAYAAIQVDRVAKARGMSASQVRALVADNTKGRTLGFLGEPRVNVLQLNLALDAAKS